MAEDNNGWSAFYYSHNKDKKEMKIWFDRDAVLGRGGFGEVFKGKFGGREVAVKRVELHRANKREEEAMLKLDHPNIVKLLHCESDKDFMYYAFEWCDASLDQLFLKSDDPKKYKGPMPHHVDALLQLASGLEHIHSHNLVHGDIKPENVLISVGSAGQDEIILKWANFGQARSVHERGTGSINQTGGNNAWLAPELMSLKLNCNVEENNCKANAKSDVFAQGLVFGCLFSNGEHLYGSMENKNEIPQNIIEGNPINMQKIDDKLRDCYENNLLKKMLEDDTGKRMTSTQVVNQLKAIKNKIAGKEKELLELCGRDSRSDLTEKIKNLIQFGINLNAKDDGGRNALHLLCRSYSSPKLTDAIKLLIENKIDVNAKDNDGLNAIHYLCRYHSSQNLIKAIQILIQFKIDAKAETNDGSNALHYLCRYNASPNLTDATKILTKLGLDLMAEDGNGWSAFYYLQNKDKKEMKIWFNRDAVLGRGGFGAVFKGKFGGREVAVKRVQLNRANKREEEAMLKLDHPNIVKLLHCESDKDFMYYALELCVASLDQLFLDPDDPKKYDGPMPHHTDALLQLASGLECIHSKNLVHRDISPENVLISVGSGGKDEIILKWSDFGHAKPVNERGTFPLSGIRGNGIWFAPETVRLLRQGEDTYRGTVKSDVFAQALVFGCLLLNGKHLYGCGEKEIHDNLIKGNPINMKKIDGKLRVCYENELLKKMLEHDPDKRMTSTQVVQQLKVIKEKIAGKEKELLELCGCDSRLDLTGKIQKLIQFGINLNAKDDEGRNSLHLLCRNYSSPKLTDAIQLLIENKIDVNAKDKDGLNAIHFLCRFHSSQNLIKAIQILIKSGIDAKGTTNDESNALHYLSRYNSTSNLLDAIDILTQIGVDAQARDKDGWNVNYYLYSKKKKDMEIWIDRDVPPIGGGGFGTVFKGKFGGREVAVKRVELHRSNIREEDAMLKLDHPNIVKLLHCENNNDFMYYALELCVATLDQLFLQSDDPQRYKGPMPRQIEVFSQLASGLEHIHSERLIHRDIKPHNILIMQRPGKNQEIIIKWSDFGLSKSVNENGLHSWSGPRGTRKWYAPEVLKKLLNEEKAENEEFWGTVKSDVFVLGLVFGYLFLKGGHLYGSKENEIHENIIGKDPVNMQKINEKLRQFYGNDLLRKMLEDDPDNRITSNEVVKQLESIKNKLTEKEEELRQLCEHDSSSRLIEKINDLIQLGIDVNAKDKDGENALHRLCRNDSNSNVIDAIRLLIKLGIPVVSDGIDARSNLRWNNGIENKEEILKLLDEAAPV